MHQRFEEAAAVRDQADQLLGLVARHRMVRSLVRAGRVVLSIDGTGVVELEDGLLVGEGIPKPEGDRGRDPDGSAPADAPGVADQASALAGDGHANERVIVAQWLALHPERVRIVSVGSPEGWALPAVRIPALAELCGVPGSGGSGGSEGFGGQEGPPAPAGAAA